MHVSLYELDQTLLKAVLQEWGQPAFRAKQLYKQLYSQLASDPQQMTDLPQKLRDELSSRAAIGNLTCVREQTADDGLTRKVLWSLPGGAVVESVLMIYPPDRATVCVSTQAGCAMGCVFCATGKLGLLRNIETGEIIEQVIFFERYLRQHAAELSHRLDVPIPDHITNLVFMGMGEPFANYDRWWRAVERLNDQQGFNLGARHMTVSTVGLVQGIRRLADEGLQINLAVSLHAPNNALRSALMPVNDRFDIDDLLDAVRYYIERTNRRVSFEYVLLEGKNDTPELAAQLGALLKGMLCHVNLIPWNPVPGTPLERSHRERVLAFQQGVQAAGVPCTVRVERGVEIAAACGQLAAIPSPTSPIELHAR